MRAPAVPGPVETTTAARLEEAHATFRRWLGKEYDLDALDAMLATVAAERMDGDPLWLLLISGPGNAKTETVRATSSIGAHLVSTLSSEAALLSAARKRGNATGGLLRAIGERGVLVIKDVTSILSMHRDTRAALLAALREIHDGKWNRNVGMDGGKTLTWEGRLAIIGAVTTAWDRAHAVIASMGDRFVTLRLDSTDGRVAASRQAIRNTGEEEAMREELAAAVSAVVEGIDYDRDVGLTDYEEAALVNAADLVTLARTAVDYDYRGDVVDAHAPEMPTRFAKQLAQLVRGGLAIGMDRARALRLAIRCARDSMPPLRLAILEDVANHPYSTTYAVRRRINKPRATVDRQLQSLHMLGVLRCDEEDRGKRTVWHYTVEDGIDALAIDPRTILPEMSEQGGKGGDERESKGNDISGSRDLDDDYETVEREAIQEEAEL